MNKKSSDALTAAFLITAIAAIAGIFLAMAPPIQYAHAAAPDVFIMEDYTICVVYEDGDFYCF